MSKTPRRTSPDLAGHDRKVIRDYVNSVLSSLSRLECAACGRVNGFDFYMVRDSVWAEAGLARDAFCCLDCLSERLGRELAIGDFDPRKPMNRPVIFGYRMARAELERAGGRAGSLEKVPGLPRLPRAPRRAKR